MEDKIANTLTNEEQLVLRESGRQPIIEIEGYPFFVDIHWGLLRPKDDFSTLGIRFAEIDPYRLDDGKNYWITYEPESHTFKELDYENITAIPKGIIVVEIPCQEQLDPIGFARKHSLDQNSLLREYPLQMHMKARTIPWNETPIKKIVAVNLRKVLRSDSIRKEQNQTTEKTTRKKGRKL